MGKLDRVAADDLFAQLRHLHHLAVIVDKGSIASAAVALNRSASVLTRSAARIEAILGLPLLERGKSGVRPMAAGEVLVARIHRIDRQVAGAVAELRALPGTSPAGADYLMHSGGKLLMLILLAEAGAVSKAASMLGLTQPGVSVALGRIEAQLGQRLFHRSSRGMVPTDLAERVTMRARLMRAEVRHALAELAALVGSAAGTMVVGSLPMARATILPAAIDAQLDARTPLQIQVVEAQRDTLLGMLRSGEVDAVLSIQGAAFDASDIVSEPLGLDRLGMVADPRHPLALADRIPLGALQSVRWILPLDGSVSRRLLDRCFEEAGLASPVPSVQSGDLLIMRRLLTRADMVAFTSLSLVRAELETGALVALDVDMAALHRELLLLHRHSSLLPARSAAMLDFIRRAGVG